MNGAREFAHKVALKCLRSGTFHFGLAAEMIEARDGAIRAAVLEQAATVYGPDYDIHGMQAAIRALATSTDRDALAEHDAKLLEPFEKLAHEIHLCTDDSRQPADWEAHYLDGYPHQGCPGCQLEAALKAAKETR